MAASVLASRVAFLTVILLSGAVRATDDFDRLYSGWVGEVCNGEELATFDCDEDESCFVFCSEKCDDKEECEGFVIDAEEKCILYEDCTSIDLDGCDDCAVHVCLENCPDGTSDFFTVSGEASCAKKHRVGKVKMGDSCKGENALSDDCVDDCQDICEKSDGCSHFVVNSNGVCSLYSKCNTRFPANGGPTWVIGHLREVPSPPDTKWCGLTFLNWGKIPNGEENWYVCEPNVKKCFKKCKEGDIIDVRHDGVCYCWEEGTGNWSNTRSDSSIIYGWCTDESLPPDVPEDADEDGCTNVYKNWSIEPRGDESPEETLESPWIICSKDCDEGDIVINTDGGCECWDEDSIKWVKDKPSVSFVRDDCDD